MCRKCGRITLGEDEEEEWIVESDQNYSIIPDSVVVDESNFHEIMRNIRNHQLV